jgi:hypothetical protein
MSGDMSTATVFRLHALKPENGKAALWARLCENSTRYKRTLNLRAA